MTTATTANQQGDRSDTIPQADATLILQNRPPGRAAWGTAHLDCYIGSRNQRLLVDAFQMHIKELDRAPRCSAEVTRDIVVVPFIDVEFRCLSGLLQTPVQDL